MTSLLDGHPAVDILTPAAAIILQDRAVIGLDPWLLDAAVSCAQEAVLLQLVTPAESRLTAPLATFLYENSGRWIVRGGQGRWYDGTTGQLLSWNGDAFVLAGDEIAAEFVEGFSPTSGSLVIDATVKHAARSSLVLADIVESCFSELIGASPAGWGVGEPVTQRWDRGELTALCRRRAPRPTALVVVGGGSEALALGTLTVARTTAGVVERLRLGVGTPKVDTARLDALGERLARLPAPPSTMLTGLQPGRSDGTVEPRLTGPVVPQALFVGPAVVREVGVDRILAVPAPDVRLIGPENRRSAWIRVLGGREDADPVTTLASALGFLGLPDAG